MRNLERAEDIDPTALAQGINWSFETFPEYLDAVDALPKGINFAANVGHSALRTWAMGERAFEEEANEEDLALMKGQLDASIRAGAIGLSTSRSEHHETSDDRPVASRLAAWDEVVALVSVLGELGAGIFEGTDGGMMASDPDVRDKCLRRMQDLAVDTGVPITFGLVATSEAGHLLDFLDDAAGAGARFIAQTHCRRYLGPAVVQDQAAIRSAPCLARLPGPPRGRAAPCLRDPSRGARLVDAAKTGTTGNGMASVPRLGRPTSRASGSTAKDCLRTPRSPTSAASGACIRSTSWSTWRWRAISPSSSSNRAVYPQDETVLLRALRHPRAVMTFSDSGAHLSQIADSSIHTHLLGYWVRERQEFSLEEAIRMITLAPALAWGFNDRGLLREGMAADINVFDPATVGPAVPRLVNDLPGGGRRLEQRSQGFSATVVNGKVTIRDGKPTGDSPGRLIRTRTA